MAKIAKNIIHLVPTATNITFFNGRPQRKVSFFIRFTKMTLLSSVRVTTVDAIHPLRNPWERPTYSSHFSGKRSAFLSPDLSRSRKKSRKTARFPNKTFFHRQERAEFPLPFLLLSKKRCSYGFIQSSFSGVSASMAGSSPPLSLAMSKASSSSANSGLSLMTRFVASRPCAIFVPL